jgi:transposase
MQARRSLVQQKVQIINSVRGLLKNYGICLEPSGEKEFSIKVRKQLDNIFETAIVGIEDLLNIYEALCVEIINLERTIEALARQDKDIKRLMTVPGAVERNLAVIMHRMLIEEKDFIYGEEKAKATKVA